MAKSLRSKRIRKMKAIKRVRYGVKERKRLDLLIELRDRRGLQSVPTYGQQITSQDNTDVTQVETMDTSVALKRNKKTMRDQFGHYPLWMNARRIQKIKHKSKVNVKRLNKKSKQK